MSKRSLKASHEGAIIAKEVFEKTGMTQDELADKAGLSSRQSVWKFFTGRPVERYIFKEICFLLDLPWDEIAELPQRELGRELGKTFSPQSFENLSVNGLVSMMRASLKEQIQFECNQLQSPLAQTQPLLEQIYILTTLFPQPSNQRWLDVSDFRTGQSELERPNLTRVTEEAVPGIELISQHDKLMILGKPGAGKTTFLQYIALQCNQGHYKGDLVPCLIQLRSLFTDILEEEEFSLLKIIINLGKRCYFFEEQTLTLLEEGKFFLLLDGLDEVAESETDTIFQDVTQFIKKYYKNHIIITSRSGFQKYYFPGFNYVELADFSSSQIKDFVQRWFNAMASEPAIGNKKAAEFLEQLEASNNQPIRELCVTPILLNLLCSVFQESSSFPTKRAKLYQAGLDILLQRWDQARGIHRDQIYHNLSLVDKIRLLSQIAATTFTQEKYFFESSDILPIIENYLRSLPGASPDLETLWLNSEAALKAIEFQHGLLIERAKDVYSFSHLTFQEYLTARKIVLTPDPNIREQELRKLAENTLNYRWREVILLTASMLNNADFLLENMKKVIDDIVEKNQDLQDFLQRINEKAESLNLFSSLPALRAFYFTLFQNRDFNLAISLDKNFASFQSLAEVLDLDYSLARAWIDSINLVNKPDFRKFLNLCFSLDLENRFSLDKAFQSALNQLKNKLPDPEADKTQIQTWWQTQGATWVEEFRCLLIEYRNIGYDGYLNQQQKIIWQQYYHANEFLVECLHGDCSLSPHVRDAIEQGVLSRY
jgi:predicted NACHT family NTPase